MISTGNLLRPCELFALICTFINVNIITTLQTFQIIRQQARHSLCSRRTYSLVKRTLIKSVTIQIVSTVMTENKDKDKMR